MGKGSTKPWEHQSISTRSLAGKKAIWMWNRFREKEILLCWWPKWRHMMPLDNGAINKGEDIEDTIAMVAHTRQLHIHGGQCCS